MMNFQLNSITPQVVLLKITRWILPLVMLFATCLFVKSNELAVIDINNDEKTQIFVSEGTIIYNAEALENVEIIQCEINTNTATHTENIRNTKVSNKYQGLKKHSLPKDIAKKIKHSSDDFTSYSYNNSQKTSEILSNDVKENVALSHNRNETSSDVRVNIYFATNVTDCLKGKSKITYESPFIKMFLFSGKYSVRPPTILS